jgi:FkbM family methyltransferase
MGLKLYEGARARTPFVHPLIRGMARLGVRTGAKLMGYHLPPGSFNYRYLLDMYEPGTTHVVKNLLRPGMIAIDVGANIGYYSRVFARLVGKRGRVLAFEPDPETFAILERNARKFTQVECHNAAVVESPRRAVLYRAENPGTSSLWATSTRGGPIGTVTVEAVALDSLLQGVQPNLVKIDVEGAELEVLQGARDLISRSRELHLIIECNRDCLLGRGLDTASLVEYVHELGFETRAIDEETGSLRRVREVSEVDGLLAAGRKFVNLLCSRQ